MAKMDTPPSNPWWRRLTMALFVVYVVLGLANAAEPWRTQHQGWAGSRRSIEARNYLRYGYLKTKLLPLDNLGGNVTREGLPRRPDGYWHHPPGTALYLSFVFAVAGEGALQAKLGFLLLSCCTFLLLWGTFRRASGDRIAFLILVFYTFTPIMATYLAFVNFETMVLLSMALVLYGWERYIASRKPAWFGLMAFGALVGVFGDFPSLPFLFGFYLVMTTWLLIYRFGKPGSIVSRYWTAVLFPIAVLAFAGLLVWLWSSWNLSQKSFDGLMAHRSRIPGDPLDRVMQKWRWYYDILGPALYVLTAAYLLLLPIRAFLRRLSRSDGYFFVTLVSSLVYLYTVKQALLIHEFYVLYLVPPLAIASGTALSELDHLISRGRTAVSIPILVIVTGVFVGFGLPRIHSKHCCSEYEFSTPLLLDARYPYFLRKDSVIPATIAARNMTRPSDRVLMAIGGFSYVYAAALDRDSSSVKLSPSPASMRLLSGGPYQALIANLGMLPSTVRDQLLKTRPHVRSGLFGVFDLTGGSRQPHAAVQVEIRKRRLPLLGYGMSHDQRVTERVTDPHRSLDTCLKLDRHDDVSFYEERIRNGDRGPDPLFRALAEYNLIKSRHGSPDPRTVIRHIKRAKARDLPSGMHLVGYRIRREPDRCTSLTGVFRVTKPLRQDYRFYWRAELKSRNTDLNRKASPKQYEWPFDVPTSLWKPGWLYTAETPLALPEAMYRITIGVGPPRQKHRKLKPVPMKTVIADRKRLGTRFLMHDLVLWDADRWY